MVIYKVLQSKVSFFLVGSSVEIAGAEDDGRAETGVVPEERLWARKERLFFQLARSFSE